jgi:hypothetical protein
VAFFISGGRVSSPKPVTYWCFRDEFPPAPPRDESAYRVIPWHSEEALRLIAARAQAIRQQRRFA